MTSILDVIYLFGLIFIAKGNWKYAYYYFEYLYFVSCLQTSTKVFQNRQTNSQTGLLHLWTKVITSDRHCNTMLIPSVKQINGKGQLLPVIKKKFTYTMHQQFGLLWRIQCNPQMFAYWELKNRNKPEFQILIQIEHKYQHIYV